jgi:hypothetical protein
MGTKTRKVFNKYLSYDWVLHSLKPSAVLDNAGYEIMSQFLTLITNDFEALELDKDTINDVIYAYRETGLTEEYEKTIADVSNYLNDAFSFLIKCKQAADKNSNSKKKKTDNYATFHYSWLNKVNTVMIMVAAIKAVQTV